MSGYMPDEGMRPNDSFENNSYTVPSKMNLDMGDDSDGFDKDSYPDSYLNPNGMTDKTPF